jgi:branched-subunit amino acid aminotransferase/4-amino-4-deoxychorismate lyase
MGGKVKEPIFMDGRWKPLAQAKVSPLNSAALYGECLLEAIPVYGGRPLFWKAHLTRLAKGCRFLGWKTLSGHRIRKAINLYTGLPGTPVDLIFRVGLFQEVDFPANPRSFSTRPPQWFALARPLRHSLVQPTPPEGKVGIAKWRVAAFDVFPGGFKWIFYMMIRKEFRENPTWDEMLRLDTQGYVADGGSSSPLWALGPELLVPPLERGGLESVTRHQVLKLARKLGLRVIAKRWKPRDVLKRGELLFVGSGVGIFRATHLQGKKLPGLGVVTQKLWDAYRSSILRSA